MTLTIRHCEESCRSVAKADDEAIQFRYTSFPRKRESIFASPWLWIPAFAGMTIKAGLLRFTRNDICERKAP